MPGMSTTRLPYKIYYLTIRRARNSKCQMEWKNSTSTTKLHYIKLNIEEWENFQNSCRQHKFKLSGLRIGHTRLTHGYLMSRNDQQPTCKNCGMLKPETGNQTFFPRVQPMEGQRLWIGKDNEVP